MAKKKLPTHVATDGDNAGLIAFRSPRYDGEDWYRPQDAEWFLEYPITCVMGVREARQVIKLMKKIIKASEEN